MIIKISDDTVDLIFKDVLLKDYNSLLEDIERLESKSTLEEYEQEDLESFNYYMNAIRVIMDYYGISYAAEFLEEFLEDKETGC